MKPGLHAIALLAFVTLIVGCQTPARGTSTIESSDGPTEPSEGNEQASRHEIPTTAQQDSLQQDQEARAALEQNVARPGSDYREVALERADPLACKEICDNQMRCMAFTYVRPDDEGGPRCRLKHSIPDKVEDQECCVSGINVRAERRIAELEAEGYEFDTNRPGNNFRTFELDRANASICKEACDNLIDCKAFTYVREGYEDDKALCQLKDQVGEPVADQNCCISGVKQTR